MKSFLIILLVFILLISSCTLKEEKAKQQEIQAEQIESKRQELEEEKQKALNDSLARELLDRFPYALNADSIEEDSFTYFFQEQLVKSSNLLFMSEAGINDIEKINGGYLITVQGYFSDIFGKLLVDAQLSRRLLKELKPTDIYETCCLVAKIKQITPITTDIGLSIEEFYITEESNIVSEDRIRNNVHLNFDSNYSPFYFINGELIDYYILK